MPVDNTRRVVHPGAFGALALTARLAGGAVCAILLALLISGGDRWGMTVGGYALLAALAVGWALFVITPIDTRAGRSADAETPTPYVDLLLRNTVLAAVLAAAAFGASEARRYLGPAWPAVLLPLAAGWALWQMRTAVARRRPRSAAPFPTEAAASLLEFAGGCGLEDVEAFGYTRERDDDAFALADLTARPPRIYLSREVLGDLSDRQRLAVWAHELGHLQTAGRSWRAVPVWVAVSMVAACWGCVEWFLPGLRGPVPVVVWGPAFIACCGIYALWALPVRWVLQREEAAADRWALTATNDPTAWAEAKAALKALQDGRRREASHP